MTTEALLMMILTQSVVTGFTVYFFIKVLKKPQSKDDSSD